MVRGAIITAIIASFTFGMANGVTRTVAIAVSVLQKGDDIVLTLDASRDVPLLHPLTVSIVEADGTAISVAFPNTPPAIGDTLTLTGVGSSGTARGSSSPHPSTARCPSYSTPRLPPHRRIGCRIALFSPRFVTMPGEV